MNTNIKILIIILTSGLLFSCNDKSVQDLVTEKNVKELQNRKTELQKQIDELDVQINEINKVLGTLDPNSLLTLVQTKAIKPEVFNHYINIQANVSTDQNVVVYPEFAGVMRLMVSEGQYVGAGQVIAIVNDGGLRDQYRQVQSSVQAAISQKQSAAAQADLARIAYEKQTKLWNQKIGSEMQYLSAKTSFEAAQKQVAAANSNITALQNSAAAVQANIARTSIRAPFSGVIDQVLTQNGQAVAPGVPIVKLVSTGNMEIAAEVPEVHLPYVKIGTSTTIDIPSIGKKINSPISRISTAINPSNRTFSVTIPLPKDNNIKPNQIAKIQINDYINTSAIIVPSKAIRTDSEGNKFVFKITNLTHNNATAKKVYIITGQANATQTEVIKGLAANDRIITEGYQKLVDGDKIKF